VNVRGYTRSALHYENLTYVQVHKAYREILDILSGMLKHLYNRIAYTVCIRIE
jgi:hypothetical protein